MKITRATFKIPVTESIKELTRTLMDGFFDINRNGCRILNILIIYFLFIYFYKL